MQNTVSVGAIGEPIITGRSLELVDLDEMLGQAGTGLVLAGAEMTCVYPRNSTVVDGIDVLNMRDKEAFDSVGQSVIYRQGNRYLLQ